MGKTRNYKNKLVKGKKKSGRTRKGGYWLYPSETDKESNLVKLFSFTKKTPEATSTVSEVSTPNDLPEEKPPVEVKAVDTPVPSEVPSSESSPEPMPESEPMPEPESEEQAGGKKRRRRKKRAGDYSEADFAKMYGSPSSSSGPKKRGSKEGQQAIAPYMGGKMPTEEDFKKMYGTTASKLESSVKKGDEEAKKYLKGYIGGEACDQPPCVSGGKRKSRRKRGSKKKHSKKKSHKKTKKVKKSKKSRKSAYRKKK